MATEVSTEKRDVALEILEKGVAMVHCDPRLPGVEVPPHLCVDPVVRLNFAYGFQLREFLVDDEAITAELSFAGDLFACRIPWDAVFAITAPEHGHEGKFWPSCAPPEVLAELVVQKETAAGDAKSTRPALSVVQTDDENQVTDKANKYAPAVVRPPPSLHIVKD